jgi:hypothetical protein
MSGKIGEPYPDFKGYKMPETIHYQVTENNKPVYSADLEPEVKEA